MAPQIRALTPADAADVLAIYADGIATGNATFETETGAWDDFEARYLPVCRLVAEVDGVVLGWVMLSSYSKRPVYRGVCEVAIYVAERARRMGIGRALMAAIIEASEAQNIWTLQAGIFPENTASLALHRAFGFETVGVRKRIGHMRMGPHAGKWRDVVLLERRSAHIGT